jgi:hypothetical protein
MITPAFPSLSMTACPATHFVNASAPANDNSPLETSMANAKTALFITLLPFGPALACRCH